MSSPEKEKELETLKKIDKFNKKKFLLKGQKMREIIFRAWDKENKQMLPVHYMKLDCGKVPYINGETFSKDDGLIRSATR